MKLFGRIRSRVCRQMATNLTMPSQHFTDFLVHFNSQSQNSSKDLLANFDIMIINNDQWNFTDMWGSKETHDNLKGLKDFLLTNKWGFSITQINEILTFFRKLKTNSEIKRDVDAVIYEFNLELEIKLKTIFARQSKEIGKTWLYQILDIQGPGPGPGQGPRAQIVL